MSKAIGWLVQLLLSNFTLTLLLLGFVVSLTAIARAPKPVGSAVIIDKLIGWFVFFSIGVSFLYNFVMHSVFGRFTAAFIGWADSPFQLELAFASLGFAAIGFLAAFRGYELRLAAILGPAIFLLGAAAGHVYQMVTAGNFAPGNAGAVFWTDILLPLIGFGLLMAARRHPMPRHQPMPQ